MMRLLEDITQEKQQHIRFYAHGFGGLHYSRMRRSIFSPVMYAKEWVNHLDTMKCH